MKNMTALGVLQIANYLIPLLVLPVVSRVLGATLFGSVGYAQNIVSYLTLLVNFGFEYSATRQVALAGDDKEKKRQLFWAVITAKAGLLVLSFVILALLPLFVERVACDPRLYIYTALTNIGIVFFPTWYLQGEQQMDKMAWANFFTKLLGALLVVALVREASMYRWYPLLLSMASIVVGIGAMIYVVRHFEIGRYVCTREAMKEVLHAGMPIFINNVFVSLYTTVNMTLLGGFATDEMIGYFSAAQRVGLCGFGGSGRVVGNICGSAVRYSDYLRRRIRTCHRGATMAFAASILSNGCYIVNCTGAVWSRITPFCTRSWTDFGCIVYLRQFVVVAESGSEGGLYRMECGGSDGMPYCWGDINS